MRKITVYIIQIFKITDNQSETDPWRAEVRNNTWEPWNHRHISPVSQNFIFLFSRDQNPKVCEVETMIFYIIFIST